MANQPSGPHNGGTKKFWGQHSVGPERKTVADNTAVAKASGPSSDSSSDKTEAKGLRASADKALNDSYGYNQHSIGRAFAVGHAITATDKALDADDRANKKDALRAKTLKDTNLK